MSKIIAMPEDSKCKIIKCPYCGCVISYQLNEIEKNDIGEFILSCPNCEKEIGVNGLHTTYFP